MQKTKNKEILVYVKAFRSKGDLTAQELPQTGRVYRAENDGSFINIKLANNSQFLVTSDVTDNEHFYCNILTLTAENRTKIKDLSPEDRQVVQEFFAGQPVIISSPEELNELIINAKEDHDRATADQWAKVQANLASMATDDWMTYSALCETINHIHGTFKDKYEVAFPEIDLDGMKFYSPHSTGFNMGNAAKYIKRYLTSGFEKSGKVEDLHKALHYILFEIAANNFKKR